MKYTEKKFTLIFILVMGLCLIFSDYSQVWAQEVDTDEFTLEEITVTAQKREENQQKVAVAMEVFSAEDIKVLGKNNIDEILSGLSNAIIQKSSDGYRISIRGMTDYSEVRNEQSTAVPTVAINLDGVYSARKDVATALYDIERVEVLYGPQSTMYSSNSPGGIVNIVTAQPKIDKYEVSGLVEYGNYNLMHTEGVINVPLSDKLAIRSAFTTSVHDGYVSSGEDNEDSKSGRIRALLQPNDKLSFTITGELIKTTGGAFGGGVEPFANQDDVDDPWTAADDSSSSSGRDETSKKISGQMNLETEWGSLSLTPSYFKNSSVSVGLDTSSGDTTYNNLSQKEKSVELKMTSPEDFLFKWIAGLTYYKNNNNSIRESDTYLETGAGSYGYTKLENTNKAIWANITYPVLDRFRLTVGARKSYDNYLSETATLLSPDYVELNIMYWELDTDGLMDYKFGFEYDLAENSMIYGDYSTSYRLKGIGKTDLLKGEKESLDAFPPEYLDAYSIGAKNRFFGNKLQVNASAYYYDYKNYEAGGESTATVWFEDDGDGVMEFGEFDADPWAGSVGDGYMLGFEFQSSAIITSKDMLNLSISYQKSEWTDLKFVYYYDETLAVVDGEVVTVPHVGLDYTGKPMMNTPPWTVTLNYSHNFNLPNSGIIKADITSKYRTGYQMTWDDDYRPDNYQEDYHMEDVSAAYSHPDGTWTLSAYVKNLFNYAEKRRFYGYPPKSGMQSLLWISDPRTYGVVLSVKY